MSGSPGALAFAILAFVIVASGAGVGSARPEPPRRVVSLNLCADPLVLALANPDQVAALSPYARDPTLSPVARRAALEPVTSGTVEAVLALRPDLVVLGPYRRQQTRALLKRFGVRVVDLPAQENLTGIDKRSPSSPAPSAIPSGGRP